MDPLDPRHGTIAGYSTHHRHKVPLCDACRAAKAAYRKPLVPAEYDDSEIALTDGEWRIDQRRRVLVWTSFSPTPATTSAA